MLRSEALAVRPHDACAVRLFCEGRRESRCRMAIFQRSLDQEPGAGDAGNLGFGV